MEQIKNPENHFFKKVSVILENTNEEKIIKTLQTIIDEAKPLSFKQFEILGSVAYMCGLDFINQKTGYKSIIIENVKKRFDAVGITQNVFDKFLETIHVLNLNRLHEPKDSVKTAILEPAKMNEQKFQITTLIKKIFKSSYLPVSYVIEIDKLMKSKDLSYMHMLNFNSMFYENMDVNGFSFDDAILLMGNEKFKTLMEEAVKRFDDQKYAIIYFDSIISVQEFLYEKPTKSNVIFDENFLLDLKSEEARESEKQENSEVPVEVPVETANVTEVPVEMEKSYEHTVTDRFFRGLIMEISGVKITDTETFLAALKGLYDDQSMMQDVYKLMKSQHTLNRENLEEVYGFDCTDTINEIEKIVEENKTIYKNLTDKYVEQIPTEVVTRIVDLINKIIKVLLIDGQDIKGHLLQQIYENQIVTYKHLHQTIGLIEKCKIKGEKMHYYTELRELIINKDEIVNIFEASQEIDNSRLKMQFYLGVSNFLQQKENTVEKPTADLQ